MNFSLKGALLLSLGLFTPSLRADPSEMKVVAAGNAASQSDGQMLIQQAYLLPSGIYTLRRQKSSGSVARALPQKKPRRKLNPGSMAFGYEMSAGR